MAQSEANGVDRLTLLLTKLIRVGGLILAVHEGLTGKDPVVMGVGVVMMAGGDSLDRWVTSFLGNGK